MEVSERRGRTLARMPVTCQHRWVIDTNVVASRYPAKCRWCGAKRTFPTEPKLEHGRGNWGRRPVD